MSAPVALGPPMRWLDAVGKENAGEANGQPVLVVVAQDAFA